MTNPLQEAITAIQAGDKRTGAILLADVLKADATNDVAWLWMAEVVATNQERQLMLECAIDLNPNNEEAKQKLKKLNSPWSRLMALFGR